jgi:hypothetical protein
MKLEHALVLAAAVSLGWFAFSTFSSRRQAVETPSPAVASDAQPVSLTHEESSPVRRERVSARTAEDVALVKAPDPVARGVDTAAKPAPASGPQSIPGGKPKPELKDPIARVALSLVGLDRDAENYWAEAIFDRSLPEKEREDLMEDLNEAGLADPKHPSDEDMFVIMNRIRRIEQVAPQADEFMLDHLGEAYKDLMNLLNGVPPQ